MKPSQQQIQQLKDYLNTTLNYRETYEEVYDHIISAIETERDGITFEQAINNIIDADFGGHKNLLKVEKRIKDSVVAETFNGYLAIFTGYFKIPALFYVMAFGAALFYPISIIHFTHVQIVFILFILALIPGITTLLRLYKTGYILGVKKTSARDKIFARLAHFPCHLFLMASIFVPMLSKNQYNIWQSLNPYTITALLVLGVLYNLSLYKLYKNEFKFFLKDTTK